MKTSTPNSYSSPDSNIVDLFTGKKFTALDQERFIRLAPEHDGLVMLYTNSKTRGDKLYSMKILCWGLRADGQVVGLVPWLNKLIACDELSDPIYGQFEGYYDPGIEEHFYTPPHHKIIELQTAREYFEAPLPDHTVIIQEIPDSIGTHALLYGDTERSLVLTEVLSWRLHSNGHVQAMLIEEEQVNATPVLPGDPCLYPAEDNSNFRYFFQHHIANQIKAEDPATMSAISLLFD